MNNLDWRNIQVEVEANAKPGYVYIADITDVQKATKNGEPAYKIIYTAKNDDGEKLTVSRTVPESDFKRWLSFHTGFNAYDKNTLTTIADCPQLILVGEYKSYRFVKKVVKIENLRVRR